MGDRFSGLIVTAVIAAAAATTAIAVCVTATSAQAPQAGEGRGGAALKTSWGEPDLQGIWTDEFDSPLQRPAQYANQEFFTEAQRADLDKTRSANLNRFATEREINGAYNAATFFTTKRTGSFVSPCCNRPTRARTSCRAARAGITSRRHRRDALKLLRDTTPRA